MCACQSIHVLGAGQRVLSTPCRVPGPQAQERNLTKYSRRRECTLISLNDGPDGRWAMASATCDGRRMRRRRRGLSRRLSQLSVTHGSPPAAGVLGVRDTHALLRRTSLARCRSTPRLARASPTDARSTYRRRLRGQGLPTSVHPSFTRLHASSLQTRTHDRRFNEVSKQRGHTARTMPVHMTSACAALQALACNAEPAARGLRCDAPRPRPTACANT